MRNLTFRGYAQNKGFDPLRVPDQTLKLQQETERTLRGMREVRNQNQQNRSEQLQALKEQHSKEAAQRHKNQQSKLYFENEYLNALAKNQQQKILNLEVKRQDALRKENEWKKLGELVPQALAAYGKLDKQRLAAMSKVGARELRNLPIEVQQHASLLLMKDAAKKHSVLINKLREDIPDFDQHWHTLTSMKPYERYGAVAAQFNDYKNYGGMASDFHKLANGKEIVDENGNNLAGQLIDGKRVSNTEPYTLTQVIKNKLLEPYSDVSPLIYHDVILPGIEEYIGKEKMEINQQTLENRKRVASEIQSKEFDTWIAAEGSLAAGIQAFLYSAGDKPGVIQAKLNTLDQVAREKFSSGKWGEKEWNQLLAAEIELDNGKIVNPIEYWKNRSSVWRQHKNTRQKLDFQVRQDELKTLSNQLANNMLEFEAAYGRPMNKTEREQHIDNVITANKVTSVEKKKYFEWINNFANREPRDIQDDRETLKLYAAEEGGLKRVHLLKVSPSLWPEYMEKLKASEKLTDTQRTNGFKVLKNTVKKIGGTISTTNDFMDADNQLIYNKAVNAINEQLTDELVNLANVSPTTVLEKLVLAEKAKIEAGSGIYAREERDGVQVIGKDGKWLFANDATGFRQTQEYISKVQENPSWLSEAGAVSTKDLKSLVKYVNGDKSSKPFFLRAITESDPTRTEYEVTRDILKAEYDYDLKPTGAEHMIHYLEANQRKHLRDRPSMSKTCQLFDVNPENRDCLTRMEVPLDTYFNTDNPYSAVKSTKASGGISSFEEFFGTDEEHTTVGALIDAGNRNMITHAGAYGFTVQDLERGVNSGVLSRDDLFTRELQSNFKWENMLNETSVIYANNNMAAPIPGVGKDLGLITAPVKSEEIDLGIAERLVAYLNLDIQKLHPVIHDHLIRLGDKYKDFTNDLKQ